MTEKDAFTRTFVCGTFQEDQNIRGSPPSNENPVGVMLGARRTRTGAGSSEQVTTASTGAKVARLERPGFEVGKAETWAIFHGST